ncbi:hypothetical protein MUK42_35980 [Musa troglodytarum]|uniref:Uncharacterized protein n=1 Tax=Musa troglodytarum TaxID=320322 RepID=A0A9E7GHJ3_9LILI|nr:hypothetical protein MUK42_35980 [Musa troglodytarum]
MWTAQVHLSHTCPTSPASRFLARERETGGKRSNAVPLCGVAFADLKIPEFRWSGGVGGTLLLGFGETRVVCFLGLTD